MKLSWSVTKPCQAEELSTGTQNFSAQFRLGQDENSDSSRISKDVSNPWAKPLCQILLQFKQNLCFLSSFLLAEVVPRLLGSGDRRGRSKGEFMAWITPVLHPAILAMPYPPSFSMKAGANTERCCPAPCSPPSHHFQNSPALPEPPVSDPNTALPIPYTFISVSLHLY